MSYEATLMNSWSRYGMFFVTLRANEFNRDHLLPNPVTIKPILSSQLCNHHTHKSNFSRSIISFILLSLLHFINFHRHSCHALSQFQLSLSSLFLSFLLASFFIYFYDDEENASPPSNDKDRRFYGIPLILLRLSLLTNEVLSSLIPHSNLITYHRL